MMASMDDQPAMTSQKKKKRPKLTLRFRNIHCDGDGKPTVVTVPIDSTTTKSKAKAKAIENLKPFWDDKGVTLTADNINLFLVTQDTTTSKQGNKIERIDDDDDEEKPLLSLVHEIYNITVDSCQDQEEKKEETQVKIPKFHIIAVEYFTVLPEDLLRTVSLSHTREATYSDPRYTAKRWTPVSPLFCAAFTDNERKLPWWNVMADGNFTANGVSLRPVNAADETKNVDDGFHPFGEIGEKEVIGKRFMTLEQYDGLAGGERDDKFGILRTHVSHEKKEFGVRPKADKVKSNASKKDQKDRTKMTLATARTPLFRFKISKGTDLSRYGVASVYDNSSPNHVSLVCSNGFTPCLNRREWVKHHLLGVYLPSDCCDDALVARNSPEEIEFDNFLKEKVFRILDEEPEYIYDCQINNHMYMALPKAS